MFINQNSHNKYILMTGAPGSKWSSVARTIYWSYDIDQTDYSDDRTYHMEDNKSSAQHVGAYWDPGMEFDIHEWDKPFSGNGIRIIKSHTFAHHLEYLKTTGHPIVMVYRNDYECMEQWFTMGGFNITYPNYKPYYENPENMYQQIILQNRDIMDFIQNNRKNITRIENNHELCNFLNITKKGLKAIDESCGPDGLHYYRSKDIAVYVYK